METRLTQNCLVQEKRETIEKRNKTIYVLCSLLLAPHFSEMVWNGIKYCLEWKRRLLAFLVDAKTNKTGSNRCAPCFVSRTAISQLGRPHWLFGNRRDTPSGEPQNFVKWNWSISGYSWTIAPFDSANKKTQPLFHLPRYNTVIIGNCYAPSNRPLAKCAASRVGGIPDRLWNIYWPTISVFFFS